MLRLEFHIFDTPGISELIDVEAFKDTRTSVWRLLPLCVLPEPEWGYSHGTRHSYKLLTDFHEQLGLIHAQDTIEEHQPVVISRGQIMHNFGSLQRTEII